MPAPAPSSRAWNPLILDAPLPQILHSSVFSDNCLKSTSVTAVALTSPKNGSRETSTFWIPCLIRFWTARSSCRGVFALMNISKSLGFAAFPKFLWKKSSLFSKFSNFSPITFSSAREVPNTSIWRSSPKNSQIPEERSTR
jgi:hypothetical protein